MPVAETSGAATAPSAAVPRKSRREMAITRRLSRFADQVQQHVAAMRHGAVLEQIYALPGTERHAAVLDGNGKLGEGERGADVSRHVVRALYGVAIEAAVLGDE